MDKMIDIYMKVTLTVGTVCAVALCIALIVWAVRCVVRSVVETRYAFKVRYYIETTHSRIVDYDMRIRSLESDVWKLMHKKEDAEGEH